MAYGHEEDEPQTTREALADMAAGEGTIGGLSLFDTNPDYKVLKFDVDSEHLHNLNKRIRERINLPGLTFDEYNPHVTVAYLKKGADPKKYQKLERLLKGRRFPIKMIRWSNPKDQYRTLLLPGVQGQPRELTKTAADNVDYKVKAGKRRYRIKDGESVALDAVTAMATDGKAEIGKARLTDDGEKYVFRGMKVNKDHRGKGIATELLNRLMQHADDNGIGNIHTKADPEDDEPMNREELMKFYGKFGFKPEGDDGSMIRKKAESSGRPEVPTQDEIYEKVRAMLPEDAVHASGGLPDVQGISDVDIAMIRDKHDNLMDTFPEGTTADTREDRTIYSIPGHERPVNVYVGRDANRVNRSTAHRKNELMLAMRYPKLAQKAAQLKAGGLGTEKAWAQVLGLEGDPYDAMLDTPRVLAHAAHYGAKRKYGGQPFVSHPSRVARRLAERTASDKLRNAALLHDTVEDTDLTLDEIREHVGSDVADLVDQVTNRKVEGLSRDEQKERDRQHVMAASPEAKTLKLADRIDNLNDLDSPEVDPKWLDKYLDESEKLLGILKGTDEELEKELANAIRVRRKELKKTASVDLRELLQDAMLTGSRGRARQYGRPEPEGRDYDYMIFEDDAEKRAAIKKRLIEFAETSPGFHYKDRPERDGGTATSDLTDISVYGGRQKERLQRAWQLLEEGKTKQEAWEVAEKEIPNMKKTAGELGDMAGKWKDREHIREALRTHLADASAALGTPDEEKEMTDLSLISQAYGDTMTPEEAAALRKERLAKFLKYSKHPSLAKTAKIILDIDVGDEVLVGRFKNKRVKVKSIGVDENNQPTINGRKLLALRIAKLMPDEIKAASTSAAAKTLKKKAYEGGRWDELRKNAELNKQGGLIGTMLKGLQERIQSDYKKRERDYGASVSPEKYRGLDMPETFKTDLQKDIDKIRAIVNGMGSPRTWWYATHPDTMYGMDVTPVSDIHDYEYTYPGRKFKTEEEAMAYRDAADERFRDNLLKLIDRHSTKVTKAEGIDEKRRQMAEDYLKMLRMAGPKTFLRIHPIGGEPAEEPLQKAAAELAKARKRRNTLPS